MLNPMKASVLNPDFLLGRYDGLPHNLPDLHESVFGCGCWKLGYLPVMGGTRTLIPTANELFQ